MTYEERVLLRLAATYLTASPEARAEVASWLVQFGGAYGAGLGDGLCAATAPTTTTRTATMELMN